MDQPTARTTGMISERVGDEIVVLDQQRGVAHCLSPVIAGVWDACDGATGVRELPARTGRSSDVVKAALLELAELGLLEDGVGEDDVDLSRRDALGRLAKRAAFVTAVPLAYSLAVGTPANADSRTCAFIPCDSNSDCNSGLALLVCRTGSRCNLTTSRCRY